MYFNDQTKLLLIHFFLKKDIKKKDNVFLDQVFYIFYIFYILSFIFNYSCVHFIFRFRELWKVKWSEESVVIFTEKY